MTQKQDDSEELTSAEDATAYERPVVEELKTADGPAVTAAGGGSKPR